MTQTALPSIKNLIVNGRFLVESIVESPLSKSHQARPKIEPGTTKNNDGREAFMTDTVELTMSIRFRPANLRSSKASHIRDISSPEPLIPRANSSEERDMK
jgi:hypothetical protein